MKLLLAAFLCLSSASSVLASTVDCAVSTPDSNIGSAHDVSVGKDAIIQVGNKTFVIWLDASNNPATPKLTMTETTMKADGTPGSVHIDQTTDGHSVLIEETNGTDLVVRVSCSLAGN